MSEFKPGDRVAFIKEPFHNTENGRNYEGIIENWRDTTARVISRGDLDGDYDLSVPTIGGGMGGHIEVIVSKECLVLVESAPNKYDQVDIFGTTFGDFTDAPMMLVYEGVHGTLHYQPWEDLVNSGTLTDPDTGEDMQILGWVREIE